MCVLIVLPIIILCHVNSKQESWDHKSRPVNNDKGMLFSAQPIPMAPHAAKEYVTSSLSKNFSVTGDGVFCAVRAGAI
jgi:hypothetical protein